jgi:hypothetical protein
MAAFAGIDPNGNIVGPTDQRSKIGTFNIAPSWTHVLNTNAVFTLGAFVRRDDYNYYPSKRSFRGPRATESSETVGKSEPHAHQRGASVRSLLRQRDSPNQGWSHLPTNISQRKRHRRDRRSDLQRTLHHCRVVTSSVNPFPYVAAPGLTPADCPGNTGAYQPNIAPIRTRPAMPFYPNYNPTLAPYDLTRGGVSVRFQWPHRREGTCFVRARQHHKGNWSLNLGLRGDFYNGLSTARQAEPRVGVAYNVKQTNTILRVSYARTLESPFNENLILSSIGCGIAVLNPLLLCSSSASGALSPGFRNEFHAGIEQAFGKYLVFSGEWISKYTHNGYDFSVLGNTPITSPLNGTTRRFRDMRAV